MHGDGGGGYTTSLDCRSQYSIGERHRVPVRQARLGDEKRGNPVRHRTGSDYSLEPAPIRPALSARSYVARFNRGSSPVASVVAMYSRIRP